MNEQFATQQIEIIKSQLKAKWSAANNELQQMAHQVGQDTLLMREKKIRLSKEMQVIESDMRKITNITNPDPAVRKSRLDTARFY